MARLNQIVAVVSGKKTRVEKEFGELNKVLQKADLFHGIARQDQPVEENGEELPSERKDPQKSTKAIIRQARTILTDIIDAVATQEYGNCVAKADVKVDGKAKAQTVHAVSIPALYVARGSSKFVEVVQW
jgi:hypothetical protein